MSQIVKKTPYLAVSKNRLNILHPDSDAVDG